MEEVTRGLQRRELAAAKLPEGEPERAAAGDPVSMAEVRPPRREPGELPAAYVPRRALLPWRSRGNATRVSRGGPKTT